MTCERCGKCCSGGWVQLNRDEYYKLKKLGVSLFYNREHKIYAMNIDNDCKFLKTDGCEIYNERPSTCRDYFCEKVWKAEKPDLKMMNRIRRLAD